MGINSIQAPPPPPSVSDRSLPWGGRRLADIPTSEHGCFPTVSSLLPDGARGIRGCHQEPSCEPDRLPYIYIPRAPLLYWFLSGQNRPWHSQYTFPPSMAFYSQPLWHLPEPTDRPGVFGSHPQFSFWVSLLRVKLYDYQAMCKHPYHYHSGARNLLNPLVALMSAAQWFIGNLVLFFLEFSLCPFWASDNTVQGRFHLECSVGSESPAQSAP
uniref:Uncharacterized protein n=1 Tax=Xenopus tropicalis TaxID=8364 RepID=A0A1B8Y9H6_XENTR